MNRYGAPLASLTTSPKKNKFVRGDDDGDNRRSTYLKADEDVTGKRHAHQHDTPTFTMVRKAMMMTKAVASGSWYDKKSGVLIGRCCALLLIDFMRSLRCCSCSPWCRYAWCFYLCAVVAGGLRGLAPAGRPLIFSCVCLRAQKNSARDRVYIRGR